MSKLPELQDEIETFEAGATVPSAALLSRYSELKKRCQDNKIHIFVLLKPKSRRVILTAFTSFGNATAIFKRLGGPPWNASIDDLVGAFGEETLLSECFLRALDDLSQMEPPPSWHQARQAITRASLERKASTGNTRISRLRLFTPKDVLEAKSFLHPGVTVCNKRKNRGTLACRKRARLPPVPDNDSRDDSSKDGELALTTEQHCGDLEGDELDTVQDGGSMGDFASDFISDDSESTSESENDWKESDVENGLFINSAQASRSAEEGTQEDLDDEADGPSTPKPAAAFGANGLLSPPRPPKTPPSQLLAHGFPLSSPVMELAIRSGGGRSVGREHSASLMFDDPPNSPTASIGAAASRLSGIRQENISQQVLSQLGDGGCVGHGAIWALLELLASSPELRVIDVAYPNGSWADWASLRRHEAHPGVEQVLVPLYVPHARHWVLLHFDLATAHVTVFDSLLESRTSSRSDYFEAARAIVQSLGLDWVGGAWYFEVDQRAPLQDDANSCGIFVVVTSVYVAAKEAVPSKINARIWRLIFRCVLARNVSEIDLFSFGCGQALPADLCGAVEHTRRKKAVLDDLDSNVGLAEALSTNLLASAVFELARLGVNVQKWQDARRMTEQLLASLDALGSSADTKSAFQTTLLRLTEEQSRVNAVHEREMAKEKRLRAFCEVVLELKVQCRVLQETTEQEITRAVDMLRSLL